MEETPLSVYYQTVYLTKCPYTQESIFSSVQFLTYFSRIIALLSFPIQLLTAYCIWKRTPDNMKSVKASLMNLNFWCTVSLIASSFFMCPYLFFPYIAGFNAGVLTDLNVPTVVQFYISFSISFAMIVSMVLVFESRSSSISQNRFRIKTTSGRLIWTSLNFFGLIGLLIPILFDLPDQINAKMNILKTIPCPTIEFFTQPVLVLASEGFWETYDKYACITMYIGLTSEVLFFTSCCIYYLFISKNIQVSCQTRRLQIRCFYGIVLQTLIPVCLTFIPLTVSMNHSKGEEYNQPETNMVFITLCLQNSATSLSILIVHQPYRRFLKTKLWCKKKKISKIVHVSSHSL
uniref:Serpentine Receptor, class H n=1 Tax=Caenorhabditis tropicalis TaxID=1561998 RepID=A0A1I7TYB6_9PELO